MTELILDRMISFKLGFREYWQLTKPTISMLVVVTTLPGMLLASGELPSAALLFGVFIGTWLSSASGAVFNQLIDIRIDRLMDRTKNRPLVTQKVPIWAGALLAVSLGVIGPAILCTVATPMAAGLAVIANVYYVVFYTGLLKMRTVQNIVIGGAAGAVGPLIGWAAVTNDISWVAVSLFLVIFLWTPPHFWALSIKYKDDYAKAGVPMLPVIKGYEVTRANIFGYTLTLVPLFIVMYWQGAYGLECFAVLMALTLYFVWRAYQLYASHQNKLAMPVFLYSCLYLLLVFAFISLDRFIELI